MARPGLEPGTPRFSDKCTRIPNGAEIPAHKRVSGIVGRFAGLFGLVGLAVQADAAQIRPRNPAASAAEPPRALTVQVGPRSPRAPDPSGARGMIALFSKVSRERPGLTADLFLLVWKIPARTSTYGQSDRWFPRTCSLSRARWVNHAGGQVR